jgi:hypothetical protein
MAQLIPYVQQKQTQVKSRTETYFAPTRLAACPKVLEAVGPAVRQVSNLM